MSDLSSPGGIAVAFRTLGCKVNRVESDSIAADLLGRGVRLAGEDEAAVIVINTCTVTGEADAKARKAVRQALGAPREPVVVVTGCLAALDAGALSALGDRVVVEVDKERVAERVAALLDAPPASGIGRGPRPATRTGIGFRTRAMLKVEDGCDNFCAYCIVPYARGLPRGAALTAAVAEAEALSSSGVREIVLTGINIGRYRDPETGADLADLVSAIASTGIERLRLSSIEPPDLTERLIGVLAATPAVCEHLHVPLQSGSDGVLSAMGRRYTAEEYAERIAMARACIPGLALTTDVIAGLPGESERDHAETYDFVRRMAFSKLHVFRYSPRRGTPAAARVQLAPDVRAERARQLRELGKELRAAYVARRHGCAAELLVESVNDGRARGTTRDYLRVETRASGAAPGDIVDWTLAIGDVKDG